MWKIIRTKIIIILIIFIAPMASSYYTGNTQQRWWQRSKQPEVLQKISTLQHKDGVSISIEFRKGRSHNHPLMAFWIEDTTGAYIQSLYVAESIATGYFRHGDAGTGRWEPGPLRRPAALPYWGHKRGVKAPDGYYLPTADNPMSDAVTGPTPKAGFILQSRTEQDIPRVFNVLMEINQSWDWNRYWHNNKFPGDEHYRTSSQPALVYKASINLDNLEEVYEMQPIGHSHWSGACGDLFKDLSTITTALDITDKLKVTIHKK